MAGIILNRNRQVPAEETPAFGGIAERFRRAGDLDRAIALCREGLKRFPDQLSARVTLGWSYLDKGQYDAARAELEQVLRKAPDNLAAIRGLAELHDRTEGALPPEDERSWRTEEPVAAREPEPAPPLKAEPETKAAAEALAPIHVSAGQSAPEVLHTAAHAEMAAQAAASDHVPMSLDVAPVELEGLADASMAAANEPVPFFVVEPEVSLSLDLDSSVDSAPAPFEVLGPSDGAPSDFADVASFSSVGLSADDFAATSEPLSFDAGSSSSTRDSALSGDLTAPADADAVMPADWAELAALAAESDAAAEASAAAASWDERPVAPLLELSAAEAPALEDVVGIDAAAVVPESLDDVDELAGQDIGDAIKALEAAARRVEARFAIRPALDRPAVSNEEIAAFELVPDTELVTADALPATVPAAEWQDSSFELKAPDLTDLAFVDQSGVSELADVDADASIEVADIVGPRFDFERPEAPQAPDIDDGGSEAQAVAGVESTEPAIAEAYDNDTVAVDTADLVSLEAADSDAVVVFDTLEPSSALGEVDADQFAHAGNDLLADAGGDVVARADADVLGDLSLGVATSEDDTQSADVDVLGALTLHASYPDTIAYRDDTAANREDVFVDGDDVAVDIAVLTDAAADGDVVDDTAADIELLADAAVVTVETVDGQTDADVAAMYPNVVSVDAEGVELQAEPAPESLTAQAPEGFDGADAGDTGQIDQATEEAEADATDEADAAERAVATDALDAVDGDTDTTQDAEWLAVAAFGDLADEAAAEFSHDFHAQAPAADAGDVGADVDAEPDALDAVGGGEGEAQPAPEAVSQPTPALEWDAADTDWSETSPDEDLAIAALVATETSPSSWPDADLELAAPAAVTSVYDVPVYSPLTTLVAAEVGGLAIGVTEGAEPEANVGRAQSSTRLTLNRLERFLRQVQARRLELSREPVA